MRSLFSTKFEKNPEKNLFAFDIRSYFFRARTRKDSYVYAYFRFVVLSLRIGSENSSPGNLSPWLLPVAFKLHPRLSCRRVILLNLHKQARRIDQISMHCKLHIHIYETLRITLIASARECMHLHTLSYMCISFIIAIDALTIFERV